MSTMTVTTNLYAPAKMFLQTTSAVSLVIYAIGLYISSTIVYGLFLCPTRHLPGPFVTRFSGLPFALHLLSGEVSARIHQQHEKYGPVLRLAPKKVDVQLLQASQDAWAGHNEKHLPWDKEYSLVASERYGLKVDNVVSLKQAKDALKMRRIMGKPFAKKFLQDQEDIFKDGTIKFIDRVEDLRKRDDGKVDIYAEFGNYAFDILTEIVYGGHFKKAAIRPGVSFIQLIGQASAGLVLGGNFPFAAWILERIPLKMFDWIRSGPELYNICAASIKAYRENAKPGSRKDSLGALISSTDDDGNHLTDLQLLSNAFLLYVAGTETVSNAATFTIYELAKQPRIATRLAQELSVFQSVKEFETVKLERLPLLNAVIREGLRLYSPVGGPGGREAPREGVMMGDYYVPGGVAVSRQSYSVCRDKTLYPEPLLFKPERWLGLTKEEEAKMWDATMIFSYGPRVCLGKEMAMIELRMLIAAFVMEYSWEGVPDSKGKWDEEMKAVDFMVVRPNNEKCVLRLHRRNNSQE